MNHIIMAEIGALFIIIAMYTVIRAYASGRKKDGRWPPACKTRFKIAVVFAGVGVCLVGVNMLLIWG